MSLFGMNKVKSLDRAVWERTRAVHYVSGDYMLRPWHNASTIAARMGGSVTDDQATNFFIPKRDIHAPLVIHSACRSEAEIPPTGPERRVDPAIRVPLPCSRPRGRATSFVKFVMRIF